MKTTMPNPPPLPVPSGSPLPSRELVTNQQFQTLLDVLGSLQPYLLVTQREMESGVPKELEGGIVSSAASTFIRVCNCIDSMLSDESRWKLKENDALYAAMTAHYAGMTKVHEQQFAAFENTQKPSYKCKPSFTVINGEYISFWGNPHVPGGLILGRGKTPAEALQDFDAAFERVAAEQLRFASESEKRLSAPPAPPVPEATKKKKRGGRKGGY